MGVETAPSSSIVVATAGGSETILIVEDDSIVRRLMVRGLGAAGYQTLTATDGADGLRVVMDPVTSHPGH
jgi:DNA-binding NtrC family response regulator